MRVLLSLAVVTLLASVASAEEMTYAECQKHCLKHNQPMAVAVGKCEYTGDVVRADWLKDEGYSDGLWWFAPADGKMWYSGTTKPTLVNGSYFPPAATIRQYRTVGGGSCASGSCGR